MKILLRLPNWIGDAVMATPAINTLCKNFLNAEITLVGSSAVLPLFENDPRFSKFVADSSKKSKLRILGLRKMAKELGKFDLAVTFRNSIACTLMVYWTGSTQTVGASNWLRNRIFTNSIDVDKKLHQAQIYHRIVTQFLGISEETPSTHLVVQQPEKYIRPTLGIAPGASYGDAKRWLPERFAEVAIKISKQYDYDIVVLGSPAEKEVANQIEEIFQQQGIKNYQNCVGKTTIPELLKKIAGVSLFITNDSGPMHIAGAMNIPTVAVFGPTIPHQTHPWGNTKLEIVIKPIPCAPCMKRTCPYKHHNCMKQITTEEVFAAIQRVKNL